MVLLPFPKRAHWERVIGHWLWSLGHWIRSEGEAVEWELAEGTVVGAQHDAISRLLNPTTRHGPDRLPRDEPLPELSIFGKTRSQDPTFAALPAGIPQMLQMN